MTEGGNGNASGNGSASTNKKGLSPAVMAGIAFGVIVLLVIAFRQVPGLRNSRFGRMVRKVTGAADKAVTGDALGDAAKGAAGKVEGAAEKTKEGVEYLAENPDAAKDDNNNTQALPTGAEMGMGGDNLVGIDGAKTHDECMQMAKEKNYNAFAMKKGDDGKFTQCFGYSTEFTYPLTTEMDTSYTACSDPAMEVANMCAASMDDDSSGPERRQAKVEIAYEDRNGYNLHTGKTIEFAGDYSLSEYKEFAKDINQCGQECDEEDVNCVGFVYTSEGGCNILNQEALIKKSALIDNEGGALYEKILPPKGYKIDAVGKDRTVTPIGRFSDVTAAECGKKCDAKKDCAGFSLFKDGRCQLKNKKALDAQQVTRPSGSTFYTKNAELMKPQKPDKPMASEPAASNDVMVEQIESVMQTSGKEGYTPDSIREKARKGLASSFSVSEGYSMQKLRGRSGYTPDSIREKAREGLASSFSASEGYSVGRLRNGKERYSVESLRKKAREGYMSFA